LGVCNGEKGVELKTQKKGQRGFKSHAPAWDSRSGALGYRRKRKKNSDRATLFKGGSGRMKENSGDEKGALSAEGIWGTGQPPDQKAPERLLRNGLGLSDEP